MSSSSPWSLGSGAPGWVTLREADGGQLYPSGSSVELHRPHSLKQRGKEPERKRGKKLDQVSKRPSALSQWGEMAGT